MAGDAIRPFCHPHGLLSVVECEDPEEPVDLANMCESWLLPTSAKSSTPSRPSCTAQASEWGGWAPGCACSLVLASHDSTFLALQVVDGLCEEPVGSAEDALELIAQGDAYRKVGQGHEWRGYACQ